MKVLIITNELLNTCGVSKHLLYFLNAMKAHPEIKFTILCGGGNSINRYSGLCEKIIVDNKFKHENRSYFNYVLALVKLFKLVLFNNYAIIHTHNHYAANLSRIISRLFRIKTIQTCHGIIPEKGRLSHFSADYIIAVNEHIIKYLIENKIKEKSGIRLIRYGLNKSSGKVKDRNSKLKILCASRLVYEKGPDIFINAVQKLPESIIKQCDFLIAGEGDMKVKLLKMISDGHIEISYLEDIPDLREILSTTDIFILPSRSVSEGFPLSICEAGFEKNLVITSNFLGLNSIFSENEDGIVFQLGDEKNLAEKIIYSISNFENLQQMINNFHNKCLKEFKLDLMIDKTINLYNNVIAN